MKKYEKNLITKLQTGNPDEVKRKRKLRVDEAKNFKKGSKKKPKKHSIAHLVTESEVYFLKPGKDASRPNNKKSHDMNPKVDNLFDNWAFERLLAVLLSFSFVDFRMFKIILVLIYRCAFLLDHTENENGEIRYQLESKIEQVVKDIDQKFFPVNEFHLIEFLYFIDLLGWNEDVHYFSKTKDWQSGRINTLLTFIRIPYFYHDFFSINKKKPLKKYSWHKFFKVSQSLMRSRGVAPATQQQLLKWFPEYIKEDVKQMEII